MTKLTDHDLDERLGRLLDRFGTDAYNHSNHPLIGAVQDFRLRCPRECACKLCVGWRQWADRVMAYVESQ